MPRSLRALGLAAVAAVLVAALTGCIDSGYPDPHGERGPEDAFPASADYETVDYDFSTSLKSASYEGIDVYLVWPTDSGPNTGGAPCLALVAETSSIACMSSHCIPRAGM
jgi:hypothetical protein